MTAAIPNNPQLVYHVHAKYMSNATIQRIGPIELNTTIPEKHQHCFALPRFTPEVTIPRELRVNFQSILKG